MVKTKTKLFAYAFIFLLSFVGNSVQADPQEDANYIVSQTVTRIMFESLAATQRPLIISALKNDLGENGITLPNPERLFDLLLEEFLDEFVLSMQDQSASIFLQEFSEQELADIANFLKTESGQAYLLATPTLMKAGAEMGRRAGQRAGANAGKRLASRIESEGLVIVDDPGLLSRLLKLLR